MLKLLGWEVICFYSDMSILQEYQNHSRLLGGDKIKLIDQYISSMQRGGISLLYSDVIYNKEEFEKFQK